jgi:hypothetical protein
MTDILRTSGISAVPEEFIKSKKVECNYYTSEWSIHTWLGFIGTGQIRLDSSYMVHI